jgi:hypothetical protein
VPTAAVCGDFAGADAFLLVAGLAWRRAQQSEQNHAGQRHAPEPSRFGAAPLVHGAQPRRCHPGSAIVTTIPAPCKGGVHPADIKNPGTLPTADANSFLESGPQHPPKPREPHSSRVPQVPASENRINVLFFSYVWSFRDRGTHKSPHSANHLRYLGAD